MLLALEHIEGPSLDALDADDVDEELLDAVWRQVEALHAGRLAHGALHARNILVTDLGPVLVDFGTAQESAGERLQAMDRAELLASLAPIAGSAATVASARRVIGPADLATALAYLQPLGLSKSTRKGMSKAQLKELRDDAAAAAGVEPPPLERLVRVKPKTLLTIAAHRGCLLRDAPAARQRRRQLRGDGVGELVVVARGRPAVLLHLPLLGDRPDRRGDGAACPSGRPC